MDSYILYREDLSDGVMFVRELSGDNSYTDDLGCALIFNNETLAFKERIDDERVAKVLYDEHDTEAIVGYDIIED